MSVPIVNTMGVIGMHTQPRIWSGSITIWRIIEAWTEPNLSAGILTTAWLRFSQPRTLVLLRSKKVVLRWSRTDFLMIYLMKSVPNRIRNLSKDEPISEAARSLASPERHTVRLIIIQ